MSDERTIEARIYERLSKVIDPELGRSVTDLGMIAAIDATPVAGETNTYDVRVRVELTVEGCPLSQTITNQINGAVASYPDATLIPSIEVGSMSQDKLTQLVAGLKAERKQNPFNKPGIRTRIFAIASGKGGVGKTWFSITLAHALSGYKQKTLLFDGDLGLANVDIQLGLMVKDDLGSVIAGSKTLNQVIHHCDKTRFDIIAGRSGSAGLASMPIGRLQILGEDLSLLASSYNKVILDMGAGVEKPVRILSSMAEKIIVLCTDEPTSLTDAYAFIKIMAMQYPKSDLNVVINQANSIREGQRTYDTLLKACTNFLKINPPLLGIIRRDTRVRDAIRNQTPLINRFPTSEAAEDVIAIARKLITE